MQNEPTERPTESEYWEPYSEFAKTLRTWFVGYGVGVPALVLTQAELRQRLANAGDLPTLAVCFLSGVFLQVMLTLIYKTAMWELYMTETQPPRSKGLWYRSAFWISEQAWIELLVDVATIVLFAIATLIAFSAITNPVAIAYLPARACAVDSGFIPPLH
jgi:hypothetical protein